MKGLPLLLLAVLSLAAVGGLGCRRETSSADASLQLQRAFPVGGDSEAIRLALAATRSNDLATGVIALQAAKTAPGLTAAQLIVIEQAAQAMTAELTRNADSGDPKARRQLEAIERSRSQ